MLHNIQKLWKKVPYLLKGNRVTVDEYFAQIHILGLTPTKVASIYRTRDGEMQRVPDPTNQTAEQRIETMARIKFIILGEANFTPSQENGF